MAELRENLEWATQKAKETFESSGYHTNILLAFKKDDISVIQLHYHDEIEKRTELAYIKTTFAREQVDAYIYIAEAWATEVAHGKTYKYGDAKTSPQRKEVLCVLAVSKKEKISSRMEIFRDGDRAWLGDPVFSGKDDIGGALTELLEPEDDEPKIYS